MPHFLVELCTPELNNKRTLLEAKCDVNISKEGVSFGTTVPETIKWSHILKVRKANASLECCERN